MQWLNDLTSGENRMIQIGLLAACGIAALVALAIVYRLVYAQRLRVPTGRTRQPRLGLVDAFSLDGQRQLVLVRRDNVEHLIMIGGPNDVLVESQISRAFAPVRENNVAAQPAPGRRVEPGPPSAPPSEPPPAKAPAPLPAAAPAAAARLAGAAASVKSMAVSAEPKQVPAPKSAPQPEAPKSAPLANAAQSKAAPAGRAMPPPIAPLSRANLAPTSAPAAVSSFPAAQPDKMKLAPPPETQRSAPAPMQPDAAPGPKPIRPDSPSPHSESDLPPLAAPVEVSATMTSPAAHAPAIAKAEVEHIQPIEPPPRERPAAGAHSPSSQKSAAEDPFAELDSLEAEMARLLGREKLN